MGRETPLCKAVPLQMVRAGVWLALIPPGRIMMVLHTFATREIGVSL